MTQATQTRIYRADVVGSLLRPPELLAAAADYAAGRIDRAALRAMEDRAVLDAIRLQEAVGLDVLTDGEFRRKTYLHAFFDAVEGVEEDAVQMPFRDRDGQLVPVVTPGIVGKLRKVANPALEETRFLRQHTDRPIKVALSGASLSGMYVNKDRTPRAYPQREELRADIERITCELVEELVGAGVPYVQLDLPNYCLYCDPELRAYHLARGRDPDAMLAQDIAEDNGVIAGLRGSDVTFGLHLCRGNYQSSWFASGGYEPIAELVFQQTYYDTLLLEYDSERAGDFAPLRFVPADKVVVLGLISTKEPRLETEAELTARIEEAARYVPLERLALSPQCGFASVAPGNKVTPDVQRAKLERLVRVARQVWRT